MSATAGSILDRHASGRIEQAFVPPNGPVFTPRLGSTLELMGTWSNLAVPRLDGVPLEYRFFDNDNVALTLARHLVELDIATPDDWKLAKSDPFTYVRLTLEHWIRDHGGAALRRRFLLSAALTSCLDEYSERTNDLATGRLYLTVDADRAGFMVLLPTLRLLERVHPRLPVTFFHLFTGAVNRWVRVYDYRDAEDRVEMLREWIEGEGDEAQYEIPDVAGCIPQYLKQKPLGRRSLRVLSSQVQGTEVKALVDGVLELSRLSERAERPELTEEMREQMYDSNPALPGLLAVFSPDDAVDGCFEDEAQTMMEVTPEPTVMLPFNADDPATIESTFQTFGVVCETLAAVSRLIDQMPGNDGGIVVE